jgi:hypothetical protein
MVVTGDHQVDGVDPERAQLGHDARRVSGVDERRLPSFPDQDCVALAHIKKAKLELLAPGWKGQKQKNQAEAEHAKHETRPPGIPLRCDERGSRADDSPANGMVRSMRATGRAG